MKASRRVAIVVLLALTVWACSTSPPAPSPEAEATELVSAYESALVAGHFSAAMALRCETDRIARREESAFRVETRRLLAIQGAPTVTHVSVRPTTHHRPDQPLPGRRELLASLRYARGATGTIGFVVGRQHGRLVLCGSFPATARALQEADPRPVSLGTTDAASRDLVPAPPPGVTSVEDGPAHSPTGGPPPIAIGSWVRSWQTGTYGGVRVTVARYSTMADATKTLDRWTRHDLNDGQSLFDVPGIPGALGIRYLGNSWLWAQTSSVGPLIDDVLLRWGPVLVAVEVGGLPASASHAMAIDLAVQVVQLAGS